MQNYYIIGAKLLKFHGRRLVNEKGYRRKVRARKKKNHN